MCDPVSLGSLAVGAAGSLYSANEANNTQNSMIAARNAATNAELGRQKAYGDQSRGIFDTSVNLFDPATQGAKLAGGQADAGKFFASNAPTDVGHITTANAPKFVGDSENAKVADVFRTIGDRGAARGNLQGYDQTNFGNNVALNDNARKIDTIGDFSKVSGAINKTEQDAAYKNAYKAPSGIGDLLKFAGQAGSYYGGRGGALPFGMPGSSSVPDFRMGFASPMQRA